MIISTLQDWVGSWKELKQWCLYKVTSTPLGAIVGAIWFRTDLGRAILHDGTKEQPLAHLEDIAELESEKLSASVAATTYAPRETTLSDEAASTTLPSTGLATLVGLLQTVRNCLKYLTTNMLDNSLTTVQTMAGSLVVNSATTPLTSSRTSNSASGGFASLNLSHKSSVATGANFGVSLDVTLQDSTTGAPQSLGSIVWVRNVGGDLDNTANRRCVVEFWGANSAGNIIRQLAIESSGQVTGGSNPPDTENSFKFATTAWVKGVAPQLSTGFSAGTKMWYGTVAAYQAIGTKDANTLYHCY